MPVLADEAIAYGYAAENRHLVQSFLHATKPALTFEDGLEVVKLLMAAYQSAEQGRTIALPARGLESYKPLVARGKWRPAKA
jgi:predicted dehydrogenase